MCQLPIDILHLIFSYLDKASYTRLRRVCFWYNRIIRRVTDMYTNSLYELHADDYIHKMTDNELTVMTNWLQNITQDTLDHNLQIKMLDISMVKEAIKCIDMPNLIVLKSKCDDDFQIHQRNLYTSKLRVIINVLPDYQFYGKVEDQCEYLFNWDWRSNILIAIYYDSIYKDKDDGVTVYLGRAMPYVVICDMDDMLSYCKVDVAKVQIYQVVENNNNMLYELCNPYVLIVRLQHGDWSDNLIHYTMPNLKCVMLYSNYYYYRKDVEAGLEDLLKVAPNLEELYLVHADCKGCTDEYEGCIRPLNVHSSSLKYVQVTHCNYVNRYIQNADNKYTPCCLASIRKDSYMLTLDDIYRLYQHFNIPMADELRKLFDDIRIYKGVHSHSEQRLCKSAH